MIVLCIAVNVAVTAYCIHYLDKESKKTYEKERL